MWNIAGMYRVGVSAFLTFSESNGRACQFNWKRALIKDYTVPSSMPSSRSLMLSLLEERSSSTDHTTMTALLVHRSSLLTLVMVGYSVQYRQEDAASLSPLKEFHECCHSVRNLLPRPNRAASSTWVGCMDTDRAGFIWDRPTQADPSNWSYDPRERRLRLPGGDRP